MSLYIFCFSSVDQQTRNEITVTDYQTRLNYADSIFSFDKKQYPNAEIIDLR